jgi:DnaJ-class molecular chaperone
MKELPPKLPPEKEWATMLCPDCDGDGRVLIGWVGYEQAWRTCARCGGSGRVPERGVICRDCRGAGVVILDIDGNLEVEYQECPACRGKGVVDAEARP